MSYNISMNIIFTNINQYANVHEAFRVRMLSEVAVKYGLQVFMCVLDDSIYPEYPNITYSKNIEQDFADFCKKWKPKKICNFIDYLTRWDLVEYECEHIYFVRSCYAQVIGRTPNQKINDEWLKREQTWIQQADKVVTDSPASIDAVYEHYGITPELMFEYVNPKKYLEMPLPEFNKKAYYVGRFDKQKRFDLITLSNEWDIIGVGKNELDETNHSSLKGYGAMPFEDYSQYITDAAFGLYPAVWESNGYSVQECLAMGKIPIIQKGSGGHERLCNSSNSIAIDWEDVDWKDAIMDNYIPDMHCAARASLTMDMYTKSLEKFIEIMHD